MAVNSSELNAMDHSIWSNLKTKASAIPQKSIKHLKTRLRKVWDQITPEELATFASNFPKCLKACIKANGENFEN